jgi:DNA invertase Pin-like site-specific DNA recombinase
MRLHGCGHIVGSGEHAFARPAGTVTACLCQMGSPAHLSASGVPKLNMLIVLTYIGGMAWLLRLACRSFGSPADGPAPRRLCSLEASGITGSANRQRSRGIILGSSPETQPMPPKNLRKPAAQYVRMSTDTQEFSIENQKAEIKRYADRLGYEIVLTYCDEGKSGLTLKYRPSLKRLIGDVLSGNACFQAILVYDVSRWGRFQDDNEAAHYEFLCRHSNIPVHYCAESFANDGSMAAALLKNIKRVMAKEYSRELGVKTYAGKEHLATMGFRVGGTAGFGLRRMMLSRDGKYKGKLQRGQYKNLKTDRVTLVLGPKKEVEWVRRIFSMALQGIGCGQIARRLNEEGVTRENGQCWSWEVVRALLTHPKYMGCNVWGQTSKRLSTSYVRVPRERWIVRRDSFPATVETRTFNQVQLKLQQYTSHLFWTDEELLKRLKRLWARHGRLSQRLIVNTPGMPTCSTLGRHFGTLSRAYDLIGYKVTKNPSNTYRTRKQMYQLRDKLIQNIQKLVPNATIARASWRFRPMLRLDNEIDVCVRVGLPRRIAKKVVWDVRTSAAERTFCTILARSTLKGSGFHSIYVLPPREWPLPHCLFNGDPKWLSDGIRLNGLTELPAAVRRLTRGKEDHSVVGSHAAGVREHACSQILTTSS